MNRLSSLTILMAFGCGLGGKPVPEYVGSSGSLALAPGDKVAFAADADNHALIVIDLDAGVVAATVPVGKRPEFVIAGRNGEAFVSNRGSRTVSVVRRDDLGWRVAGEAHVGAEPTGLALSPDGALLAVANSTSGTVSFVDTATLGIAGEVTVGGTPRTLTFREGGKELYVAGYHGTVSVVSIEEQSVAGTISLHVAPRPTFSGTPDERMPSHVTSMTLSPDGKRAYLVHAQCKSDVLNPPTGPSDNYYGATAATPPVVATAITTVDVETNTPLAEPVPEFAGGVPDETLDFPPAMLRGGVGGPTLAMPAAVVAHPSGKWLFMANLSSDNLAVLSTSRLSADDYADPFDGVHSVVTVGAGPTGLAISADGSMALVHNSFDHTVSIVREVSDAAGERIEETSRIEIGQSPLRPTEERGRRLFFTALDPRMTNGNTGISCASCHGDGGRTDGHTWAFREGKRNTPTLAYKQLLQTAPFHWDGTLPDLAAFDEVITRRMGGSGLEPFDFKDLAAYLATLPEADNPHKGESLTAEQDLGKRLFNDAAKGNCASCHAGEAYSDNKIKDTGRWVDAFDLFSVQSRIQLRLATPPLRGAFSTAPYLHDGTASTLREVLTTPGAIAEMNMTGKLDRAEIDALVAYVETL